MTGTSSSRPLTLSTFYFSTNQSTVILSPQVKGLVADLTRLVTMGAIAISANGFADPRSNRPQQVVE